MTTNTPPPVRLRHHDELALTWRFSDDWRGDVGLRSNFSAMASILELGTRVQTSLVVRQWGLEDDSGALVAARRVREIDRRLARLKDLRHFRALRGAYSPRGPLRPDMLSAWRHRLDPSLEIGGVLLATPVVLAEHRASGSHRDVVGWLAGLSARASVVRPSPNTPQSAKARRRAAAAPDDASRAARRAQDAEDARVTSLVARLVDAASTTLLDAHRAWTETR
jgi:hypothetical protein